jgi:gliding motility associated protien GldN
MFKKEVIRAIDLREKQNQPLYSAERELSKLLMDATLNGTIRPYSSDSLSSGKTLSIADFQKRITIDNGEVEQDTAYMDEYEKQEYLENLANQNPTADYFFGKDLYQIELTEIIYFSSESSEMRYKIKAITIFLPAEHPNNIRGIQQPIATYDFDAVMKAFENNPNAIWYNPYNDSEHRSLANAFELRLFSSYIIKISNPNDDYITDQAGGNAKQGIIQSQEEAYDLLEFESNLWEN